MIYLKLQRKPKTISELFDRLFSYWDRNQYKSCQTYKDAEATKVECLGNKYRSVDDIVEIVQTYFPESTEQEIFWELLHFRIQREDSTYVSCLIHCLNISRPTICLTRNSKYPLVIDYFESSLMTKSKYKDWKTICAMVGIYSEEELSNIKYS